MIPGYTRSLFLLPFDHRHSYLSGMFHLEPPLSAEQTARVVDSKRVIYEGFLRSLDMGVPSERAGILVDEAFGADVLRDAGRRGVVTALSVEGSGSDEFQFEYGDDGFAAHIQAFSPTFAKVLVRYNPQGDAALNARQTERLARLSAWCQANRQRLMFELLVPATPQQLAAAGGDAAGYDLAQRPDLMIEGIRALQHAGVEPDVWKVEGLDRAEDGARVVAAARVGGRSAVSCIVLGRGADDAKVTSWLRTAATVPGFIGFAVGRTSFWDAVARFEAGTATRTEAVDRIAGQFAGWARIFADASVSAGAEPA